MKTLTIEIPDDVLFALRKDESGFVKELRLAAAVKWYELGLISQDKAAEIADLSRAKFISELSRFKVSPFQVTPADVREELKDV